MQLRILWLAVLLSSAFGWSTVVVANIEEHQVAFIQTGNELKYFGDASETNNLLAQSNFVKSANSNANGDTVSSPPSSPTSEEDGTGGEESLNLLKFDPPVLTLGEHAVGIPCLRQVKVRNPTSSKVRFDAISGSTAHFHCSFFDHKTVEPGGETAFDVVFLARSEGHVETTLYLHSSLGVFSYAVAAKGRPNPYRLRAFVGARLPLNGSFVSPVRVYNPHPITLRVTEVYSSGGNLHLELPVDIGDDGADATSPPAQLAKLWEIPPFQTKTVVQAKFIGARERNVTAYIKITADRQETATSGGGKEAQRHTDTIVVPVEVEVTSRDGLFSTADAIDFGYVRRQSTEIRVAQLYVISTLNHSLEIKSVIVEPQTPAVSLQFEPAGLQPIPKVPPEGVPIPVSIAKVSFFPAKLTHEGDGLHRETGKIIVKSKGGNYRLSVGYSATVFGGDVVHDAADTSFYAGLSPPLERNVSLGNNFPFALAIYNVSLPRVARPSFRVQLLTGAVILQPGERKPVLNLLYHNQLAASFQSFVRLCTLDYFPFFLLILTLHFYSVIPCLSVESVSATNASKIDLPIYVFEGKLRITLYSLDQTRFDFGVLDTGDRRAIQMAVTNENPVAVPLRHMRNSMEAFSSVRLLGVDSGNETVLSSIVNSANTKDSTLSQLSATFGTEWEPSKDFAIPAHSFAVFEYSIVAPSISATDGEKGTEFASTIILQSPYQTLYYPVGFQVESGAVVSIPEKIVFKNAFPGKISSQPLQVYSTFEQDMPLLRLSTLSHDPRIFFESFDKDEPSPVVKNGVMSYLGRVFFFPVANCVDDCYVGMPLHTNDGAWFVYGMRLPPNLPEIDAYLYQRLRRKWNKITSKSEHLVNATVVVDTTGVKQFQIPTEGQLVWPRLMRQSSVHFPLTAVGNFTIVNLTLQNPSDQAVVVQILPLTIYPDPEGVIHFFKDELTSPLTDFVEMNETLMFTLRDTELFNLRKDSPVPKLREQLEKVVGQTVPRFTLSMLLQPAMKVRIRVGFLPNDFRLRSSLLLIRNNLTVMEPVVLYGRGATVQMRVGNRLPRAAQPLLFEIQDRHLADCQNPKRLTHKLLTTLTVRRSFLARNTGEVPLHVTNLSISGAPCENHGFRLLNCKPFRLRPNESHMLEVAYTPDFTMSWNQASLQLYVQGNGSAWRYPLAASIPKEWLPKCQHALPRPVWEPIMYYSCVTALVFLFICIVASAYLEGDRAVSVALHQRRRRLLQNANRRRFDLNASSNTNAPTQQTEGLEDEDMDGESWIVSLTHMWTLGTGTLLWLGSTIAARLMLGTGRQTAEPEVATSAQKSSSLERSEKPNGLNNGSKVDKTSPQPRSVNTAGSTVHEVANRKSSAEDTAHSAGQLAAATSVLRGKVKSRRKEKDTKGKHHRNTFLPTAPLPETINAADLPENLPSVSDSWEVVAAKKDKIAQMPSPTTVATSHKMKPPKSTMKVQISPQTTKTDRTRSRSDVESTPAVAGKGRRHSENDDEGEGGVEMVTSSRQNTMSNSRRKHQQYQDDGNSGGWRTMGGGGYSSADSASQQRSGQRTASASESDVSTTPEWDAAPLPDSESYEADFEMMATQTENFAAAAATPTTTTKQQRKTRQSQGSSGKRELSSSSRSDSGGSSGRDAEGSNSSRSPARQASATNLLGNATGNNNHHHRHGSTQHGGNNRRKTQQATDSSSNGRTPPPAQQQQISPTPLLATPALPPTLLTSLLNQPKQQQRRTAEKRVNSLLTINTVPGVPPPLKETTNRKHQRPTGGRAQTQQTKNGLPQQRQSAGSSGSRSFGRPPDNLIMDLMQIDVRPPPQLASPQQHQQPKQTSPAGRMTLMEQLHAERKQRLNEYRQKNPFGRSSGANDDYWPGLGTLPPVTETLWDDEKEPWNTESEVWGTPPKWEDELDANNTTENTDSRDTQDAAPKVVRPSSGKKRSKADQQNIEENAEANPTGAASFKWNLAAEPFVSSKAPRKQTQKKSPQPSPKQKSKLPQSDTASFADWGKSSKKPLHEKEKTNAPVANTEDALGLSGGLFSSKDFDIWRPLGGADVNPLVSWTEALLASDDDQLPWKDAEDSTGK